VIKWNTSTSRLSDVGDEHSSQQHKETEVGRRALAERGRRTCSSPGTLLRNHCWGSECFQCSMEYSTYTMNIYQQTLRAYTILTARSFEINKLVLRTMATPSWASVASRNAPNAGQVNVQAQARNNVPSGAIASARRLIKPSPDPAHQPQRDTEDEEVYVLTLITDQAHHDRMTALRSTYFPRRINKLAAHLTFFHALPGSQLENSIIPHIEHVASQTAPFRIRATKPFRLKKGIAISVARSQGASQAQEVHRQLQSPWKRDGFLSEQDAGGCRVHYTIMNKVDDEGQVAKAMAEVESSWADDLGTAEGIGLWRYDRGWWELKRKFEFTKGMNGPP